MEVCLLYTSHQVNLFFRAINCLLTVCTNSCTNKLPRDQLEPTTKVGYTHGRVAGTKMLMLLCLIVVIR